MVQQSADNECRSRGVIAIVIPEVGVDAVFGCEPLLYGAPFFGPCQHIGLGFPG